MDTIDNKLEEGRYSYFYYKHATRKTGCLIDIEVIFDEGHIKLF